MNTVLAAVESPHADDADYPDVIVIDDEDDEGLAVAEY